MDHFTDLIDRVEKRLDRVDDKFDSINKTLVDISTSLAKVEMSHRTQDAAHNRTASQLELANERLDTYNQHLQEHMRRTELLEDKMDLIEKQKIDPLHQAFTESQVAKAIDEKRRENLYKNIKLISAIAAAIVSLITLYKFLG